MSKLDDLLENAMDVEDSTEDTLFGTLDITEAKQQIKALMLELIGETNSFESENTNRVWIDPDDLAKKVSEL